jgi:hypothetical protein
MFQRRFSGFSGNRMDHTELKKISTDHTELKFFQKTMYIHSLLHQIAGLSQAELHASTKEVEQSEPKRKKEQALFKSVFEERDPCDDHLIEVTESDPYHELMQSAKIFDGSSYFSPNNIEAGKLDDGVKAVAFAFSKVLHLSKGSLRGPGSTGGKLFEGLAVTDKGYKAHIDNVISKLDEQLGEQLKKGREDKRSLKGHKKVQEIIKKGANKTVNALGLSQGINKAANPMGMSQGLYVPGPRSQEIIGVQPIFYWILCQIANNLNKANQRNGDREDSFYQTNVARERPLLTRAKPCNQIRYPDITVSKNDAYMQVSTSDSYPITMEVKPYERAGGSHEKVFSGGVQQCLSHVAKILGLSLNFGGAGTDGVCTSVVGTLPYIQIIQLKLVGTGTSKVSLQVFMSGKLALLPKTSFQKWVKSNDPKKKSDKKMKGR